jgi:hypothetical protein
MVTRAVMRHVTPDTDVNTDYTSIELKQGSSLGWHALLKRCFIVTVETWADVFIPSDDPHAIALGLEAQRVRRKLEDVIRQFDGWKGHLTSPTVCPFVAKPMPFRFAIDVPTQYLNENALLVARVHAATTLEEMKTILQGFAPTADLQLKVTMKHEDLEDHEDLKEIAQPNDPDNGSSGLKVPKHTELLPA